MINKLFQHSDPASLSVPGLMPADLLMMPKEVLTDRAIRAEVVPGLSLRRICQLLNRFLPDDFAPDPLPPG